MTRQAIVNILLATSVIVLGAVAWLRPGVDEPAVDFIVVDLDPESFRQLRVEKNGRLQYAMQKTATQWRVLEPESFVADNDAVSRLLGKFKLRSKDRYPVKEVDLDELGLVKPFMTFTMNDRELRVGGSEAISQKRYVQVDEWVYLVDSLAIFALDRDLESLKPPAEPPDENP